MVFTLAYPILCNTFQGQILHWVGHFFQAPRASQYTCWIFCITFLSSQCWAFSMTMTGSKSRSEKHRESGTYLTPTSLARAGSTPNPLLLGPALMGTELGASGECGWDIEDTRELCAVREISDGSCSRPPSLDMLTSEWSSITRVGVEELICWLWGFMRLTQSCPAIPVRLLRD